MASPLTLIVAATRSNGIGANGTLPWRLPGEMAYFVRVTTSAPQSGINAVVMGRKSWDSIPTKFRPLKNRLNVVVSRQESFAVPSSPFIVLRSSYASAIDGIASCVPENYKLHHTFIIGGASLYHESLASPSVNRILLTRILSPDFNECDVFFPDFCAMDDRWKRSSHEELEEWIGEKVPSGTQEEKGVSYEFQMWIR